MTETAARLKRRLHPPTISELDKKLWRIFSEFIRRRDSDADGNVSCCTCGKVMHWKKAQCGHYISRSRKSTKYDEKNVSSQCAGCNGFPAQTGEIDGAGRPLAFRRYLIQKYGIQQVERLELRARMTCERDANDYKRMIKHYGDKLKEMEGE